MDTPFDRFGCEDARITRWGDRFLITYTGLKSPPFTWKGYRPLVAATKDFTSLEKYGPIGPDVENKDVVIFPQRIGGRIAVLMRISPNVQIAYLDSLDELRSNKSPQFWTSYLAELDRWIVLEREFQWEAMKVGAGPPPIRVPGGWLLIYHGVDRRNIYRTGAAILDSDNPQRVLARSSVPILQPETDIELRGDIPNVVFPTGAIVRDGRLYLYYGAADTRCCLATCDLDELVSFVSRPRNRMVEVLTGKILLRKTNIDQSKVLLRPDSVSRSGRPKDRENLA